MPSYTTIGVIVGIIVILLIIWYWRSSKVETAKTEKTNSELIDSLNKNLAAPGGEDGVKSDKTQVLDNHRFPKDMASDDGEILGTIG